MFSVRLSFKDEYDIQSTSGHRRVVWLESSRTQGCVAAPPSPNDRNRADDASHDSSSFLRPGSTWTKPISPPAVKIRSSSITATTYGFTSTHPLVTQIGGPYITT
jgi:hypothetical protein